VACLLVGRDEGIRSASMNGGIYLKREDGQLVRMVETAYESEEVLQRLLAEYPDLLAGEQVNETEPRRWLLVSREAPVPDEEAGSGRWSMDHLFLDQDGVPTLIEVKRSSDTRVRREVVGQMLDYAANSVAYLAVERLRTLVEQRCDESDVSTDQYLLEFLGPDADVESFWQSVKTNLQAGRIRLVFVADAIPRELRRVVEFLNEQMDPAEVLALEVKQYVGEGATTLVPKVLGQTEQARAKKPARPGSRDLPWTEAEVLERMRTGPHPEDASVAAKLIDWAKNTRFSTRGGRGQVQSSLDLVDEKHEAASRVFFLYESRGKGIINIMFDRIREAPDGERLIEPICDKLNPILKMDMQPSAHYPGIKLSGLRNDDTFDTFTEVLEWLVGELRRV